MAPCFSAILKTATEFIEVFTYPSLSTVEDGLYTTLSIAFLKDKTLSEAAAWNAGTLNRAMPAPSGKFFRVIMGKSPFGFSRGFAWSVESSEVSSAESIPFLSYDGRTEASGHRSHIKRIPKATRFRHFLGDPPHGGAPQQTSTKEIAMD